jgi:hypothetical protein
MVSLSLAFLSMKLKNYIFYLLCCCFLLGCEKKATEPVFSRDMDYHTDKFDFVADPTQSCHDIWTTLWPMVKSGDNSARDVLAALVIHRGLRIPNQPLDENWINTYFTLTLHDTMSHENLLGDVTINGLIYKAKQPEGREVAECIADNKDKKICVDIATKKGIVQPFDTFIASVEVGYSAEQKVICTDEIRG